MSIIGSILGGAIAAKGSRDASRAQQDAANAQLAFNRETRDLIFDRFDPAYDVGKNALAAYAYESGVGPRPEGYAGYTSTPGYDFRVQQGQQAIQSAAGLRGGIASGRTLQDLTAFGQGIASEDYGNYLRRLAGLTDAGLQAAGGQANAATNANAVASSAYSNLGNARAAGAIGQANAYNTAIGNAIGAYQYQQQTGQPGIFSNIFPKTGFLNGLV